MEENFTLGRGFVSLVSNYPHQHLHKCALTSSWVFSFVSHVVCVSTEKDKDTAERK